MANEKPVREGTALITGASAGIGADYARYLAGRNYDVILTARRTPRLNKLAKELEKAHGITATVIPADLAKPDAAAKLAADIKKRKLQVDYLVNNAGYSKIGKFSKAKWKDQADMLQVMVTAVTELANIFTPDMVKRGHGYIVNVASVAAYLPGSAGDPLYAPVKAYVKSFSQSLYRELKPLGVNVIALCPGYTYTEIHDVSGTREVMNRYPKFIWLTAPRVVREGHLAVREGRGPIVINGFMYSFLAGLFRMLPENLLTRTTPARPTAAPKKASAKKLAKKAPAKKAAAKKAPAKKPAGKKPAAKKPAARKKAAKK